MRECRVCRGVIQSVPLDLAATGEEVPQHGVGFLGGLALDDVIVLRSGRRVTPLGLRNEAERNGLLWLGDAE